MKKAEHSENRPKIALDFGDPVVCGILAEALVHAGYRTGPPGADAALCLTGQEEAASDMRSLRIPVPFRVGGVLKALSAALMEDVSLREVRIGPYLIDPKDTLLVSEKGNPIRLTDRERDTLLALARAPGRRLDRRSLLETVWLYVEGVETHAVETLVYRLRQKIEPDPANPSILLTDGQGYRLAEE